MDVAPSQEWLPTERVITSTCSLPLFSWASGSMRQISYSLSLLVASLTFLSTTWYDVFTWWHMIKAYLWVSNTSKIHLALFQLLRTWRSNQLQGLCTKTQEEESFFIFLIYSFNTRVCTDSSPSLSFLSCLHVHSFCGECLSHAVMIFFITICKESMSLLDFLFFLPFKWCFLFLRKTCFFFSFT